MEWLECHLKVKSTKCYFSNTRNNNEISFREKTLKCFVYLACYHLSKTRVLYKQNICAGMC